MDVADRTKYQGSFGLDQIQSFWTEPNFQEILAWTKCVHRYFGQNQIFCNTKLYQKQYVLVSVYVIKVCLICEAHPFPQALSDLINTTGNTHRVSHSYIFY